MAKRVHSMSMILPHVAAPLPARSRRRALFTTAVTVVLDDGITAVTTANIADLVAPMPDIDFIQSYGEFVALEKPSCAIYDRLKPTVDNKKARAV